MIAISLSCTSIFFLSLGFAVLLHQKRWKIRFWLFAVKVSWRNFVSESDPSSYEFDAFVAHHFDDFDWIRQHLMPQLEDERHMRLCIAERDFKAGTILEEMIAVSILRSRKTILLLTPKFLESHWCDFELTLARNQLFDKGRDVIVAIILKPLPITSINHRLYTILKSKLYLEWDTDDPYFLTKLTKALQGGKIPLTPSTSSSSTDSESSL